MSIGILTTGDDTKLPVELFKGGVPFEIASSAIIKASVVTKDRSTIILAPVSVLEATEGSDWFNSVVVVAFTSVNTGAILDSQLGTNELEIQIDDGGKLTWFTKIKIRKGTIDQ
jgi:hypothetical protein